MAVYDTTGTQISSVYDMSSSLLNTAYDLAGNIIYRRSSTDYTEYSYTQKWASKGITSAQGLDIYDGKVFWVAKTGDSSIPSNCYVFNLSDGSQALSSQPVTIYSGHGNNLAFAFPKAYCSPAYPPSRVYENTVSDDFLTFTLNKTITFSDGTADLDCCLDEMDPSVMWTLGHINGASTTWIISKWDLSRMTENEDGTFSPVLLHTATTAQPESNRYFQGIRHHDGILWYNSGDGGQTAFTYGIDPNTGEVLYSINHGTNQEPEGLAWVYEDVEYALYVGFQGMMLRKYTFGT